jgi:hypothetical protein
VFRPPDDAREPVSLPALEQLSSPAGAASGLLPATAADRLGDRAAASELVRIGRIIDQCTPNATGGTTEIKKYYCKDH